MAELTIFGALRNATFPQKALSPVSDWRNGWRRILEPYAGAFQQNVEERRESVVCYPTLYACLSRISQDIGKLPFLLKREDADGIWQTVQNPAYSPVLNKPNHYQTAQQFREAWTLSILQSGNTYVLKRRDNRGIVTALYVLDPCRVVPMVSDSGDVFYQINYPTAANLLPDDYPAEQLILPAREIIHDRLNAFHHQLIGVPPLCAAYWPAVKNLKILKTSAEFFSNHAQPGGILTAPAGMSDEDATRVQQFWQTNYGGENAGKVAVIGADLKYQAFATSATDAQLVEQMQYSDRQVCQPFGIPPYIVGVGEIPAGLKVDDITNTYYAFALQARIEAMEYLLDEGLGIARPLGVELDTEPLLRMDESKRAEVVTKLIGGKTITPDEGRARMGYGKTGGGATLWGQNQDYPLAMLADRAEWDPNMVGNQPPEPVEEEENEELETANEEVRRLSAELWQRKALESAREAIR